ncbi:hypothetical protein EDD17DRAFT_1896751 [Pisolithus thermaeus]|nr:hypothetical protein EDD17DRAFT_1896751 [Pisolithus thermaeus]
MSTTSHSRRNGSTDPPLQRGMACSSCRKIRCDGLRPTCDQCLRYGRVTECEYTNGNQPPQAPTPSATLPNPYNQTPQPITLHHHSSSLDGVQSAGIVHPGIDNFPFDLQYFIDTLVPHAFDLGIFLFLPRLRAQPESITPALRQALMLSSFYVTGPSALVQADSTDTLISGLHHILVDAAVAANPRLGPQFHMQTLQAEVLLVFHLLRVGRVSIAQVHINAAKSLAISLGLHMRSGDVPAASSFESLTDLLPRLPLPGDAVEEQERVDGWWIIHCLVKFTETIYAGPPAVSSTVHITAPWSGVKGDVSLAPSGAKRDTISQFLLAQDFGIEGDTLSGLQAKASVLLGEAHSVAVAYYRGEDDSADFRSRFSRLDNLIQNFFNSLPHPATLSRSFGTGDGYISRQMLLVVNLIAYAQITLHRPFALSHAPSNRICVDSAIRAVQALNGLEDQKIVNPICVECWRVFYFTLLDELFRIWCQQRYSSTSIARGPSEVSEAKIVNALRTLLSFFGSWFSQHPFSVMIYTILQAAAPSI